MFFGSAITNFGLPQLLDSFIELMPPPAPRMSDKGPIAPDDERFTAFVFKIQANMDRAHRDRVAFFRVCSGRYERGMKVHHVRLDRDIRLTNPVQFLAQERTLIDDGYAGDIIGVFDPGIFLIGDTICTGSPPVQYEPLPQFPPEHFGADGDARSAQAQAAQEGPRAARAGGHRAALPAAGGARGRVDPRRRRRAAVRRGEAPARRRVRRRRPPRAALASPWRAGSRARPCRSRSSSRSSTATARVDVHGNPVVLFKGEWQLESCAKAFPRTRFVELGNAVPGGRVANRAAAREKLVVPRARASGPEPRA